MSDLPAQADLELRVWDLLTRDFSWEIPDTFCVTIEDGAEAALGRTRLQIFEVMVAAIFARLRPEYEWAVTPNRPDGGLDFVGRNRFLTDDVLGIAAVITVGGQCKKRTRVGDIVQEVAGSLARMAVTIDPTFFVVALSARLSRSRVEDARAILEATHRRHCHILDRTQIEGLIRDHLATVEEILREGLGPDEVAEVLQYFVTPVPLDPQALTASGPDRVLAGVPFQVTVDVHAAAAQGLRAWWRPDARPETAGSLVLLGPVAAGVADGASLDVGVGGDLMHARVVLDLVSFGSGTFELGELVVSPVGTDPDAEALAVAALGQVEVITNVRPRFFARPFRPALERLSEAHGRAQIGGAHVLGVVGDGGSGKSRLCEEFSIQQRRAGSPVVTARQAKSLDDPNRLLVELLIGLLEEAPEDASADEVIDAVRRVDPSLAERATTAISGLFGSAVDTGADSDEQSLLSVAVLLAVVRCRRAPVIIHLQELHWCTASLFGLIGRFVRQLDLVLRGSEAEPTGHGALVLLEGRTREVVDAGLGEAWTSEPFESFLRTSTVEVIECPAFDPEDGREFTRLLFEHSHSTERMISKDLLEVQGEVIDRIHRSAGGNPFLVLAQVQLLKDRQVLGQNPVTGLLYLARAWPDDVPLPGSITTSIRNRWEYLRTVAPPVADLLWAATLVDDHLPAGLFRALRRALAPTVSIADLDATNLIWCGNGSTDQVTFRHEHFFQALRSFEVDDAKRSIAVACYADWYDALPRPTPADLFRWGRVILEQPQPDHGTAQRLLKRALDGATRNGDTALARRAAAVSLDLDWAIDSISMLGRGPFLVRCDREIALVRDLLSGDRAEARRRLDALDLRIADRSDAAAVWTARWRADLERRRLTAQVLKVQLLFNDRQPMTAVEVAGRVVRGVLTERQADPALSGDRDWDALEMEAWYARAVALALAGEIDESVDASTRAVAQAERLGGQLARSVQSTHANILLARDRAAAEARLRALLAEVNSASASEAHLKINLGMALILKVHEAAGISAGDRSDARSALAEVFTRAFRRGDDPDAAAAALLLGILAALTPDGEADQVSWFAQSVASASKGRQMETLWRAHINLAMTLEQRADGLTQSVIDHARAALEILDESLAPYPQPDLSARFGLVVLPLAQAARVLVAAGFEDADAVLQRYPALVRCFTDASLRELRDDLGGYLSHEWIRAGSVDLVIY